VALSVEMAAAAGLAGCAIEDVQPQNASPYDFIKAVERIEAGVEAAQNFRAKTGADFILTARADGILHHQYGLDEAIKRLRAFEKTGADVLYAPMPNDMDDLAKICKALEKPVNALCAGKLRNFRLVILRQLVWRGYRLVRQWLALPIRQSWIAVRQCLKTGSLLCWEELQRDPKLIPCFWARSVKNSRSTCI